MTKSKALLTVLTVAMVLAVVLAFSAVPALANDVTVTVNAPPEVLEGGSFTASVDITYVEAFAAAEFIVTFDSTVIAVTDVTDGELDGSTMHVDGFTTPWAADPNQMKVLVSWPPLYPGVSGDGYLCEMHFDVLGTDCNTSPIDLSDVKIANELGLPITATVVNASVHVYKPVVYQHVVVSGTMAPNGADTSGQPTPPPGFIPQDEFVPCEWLWVWGYDFEYCQWYRIWIQPYEEGAHVAPGDAIDPAAVPPGFVPVEVHIAEDGTFGPIELWHVDGEYCEYWEIVADKIGPDHQEGIYNPDEDGLDAAALGKWGFHIIPEGLTIILLTLGLACLGGYLVLRRRKGTETKA